MIIPSIDVETSGLSRWRAVRECLRHYPHYSARRLAALTWNVGTALAKKDIADHRLTADQRLAVRLVQERFYPSAATFTLSHKIREKSRLYTIYYDERFNPMGFAKLSFNDIDAVHLRQEAECLQRKDFRSRGVDAPSLVGFGRVGASWALVTSARPNSTKAFSKAPGPPPQSLFEAIAGPTKRPAPRLGIGAGSWWLSFLRIGDPRYVGRLAPEMARGGTAYVSFAHGDLGSENIFWDSSVRRFYLIDWESWADDAPWLTDRVAYWLGANNQTIRSRHTRSDALRKHFLHDFVENEGVSLFDAELALCYLISRRFGLASSVAYSLMSQ